MPEPTDAIDERGPQDAAGSGENVVKTSTVRLLDNLERRGELPGSHAAGTTLTLSPENAELLLAAGIAELIKP